MSALKVLSGLLLTIASLFILISPTHAATLPTGEQLNQANFNYFIHGQTTTEGSIGHSIFCSLAGKSPFYKCLGYAGGVNGGPLVYDQVPNGGALGSVGTALAGLYVNTPTSASLYLANLGENIGLSPKSAYAQNVVGSGNGVVAPVLKIWQAMRNLAYVIFILVFVVIGVMIMLRQRINPQTVISAQAALPGLVIGLILVTFSYFIAALIVDIAFVGIQLIINLFLFSNIGLHNVLGDDSQLKNLGQSANIFQLFMSTGLNGNALGTLYNGGQGQINNVFGGQPMASIILGVIGLLVGSLFGPGGVIVGSAVGVIGGAGAPVIVPTIICAVVLIALFIQMFRLLFGLLGAYIQILVMTIAGPLFILVGSIPGRGGTITSWWKGLLGNVLIFPAVFAAFLFAGVILHQDNSWGGANMPLFSGLDANAVKALIAFGIILGTPAIPDMVRKAVGAGGQPGIAGTALGAFMGGANVGQTAATQGHQRFWYTRDQQGNYVNGPLRQGWNRFRGKSTARVTQE